MTLFITVLGASLVGSVHCAGMCGPLVLLYAGSGTTRRSSHVLYNVGRLIAYLALGAVAGSLGGMVDLAGALLGLAGLATLSAALFLAGYGALRVAELAGLLRSSPSRISRAALSLNQRVLRLPPRLRAIGLGSASALLPCGWLYAFVAVAAGTGSALLGSIAMLAFWLGTLPALSLVGLGGARLWAPLRSRAPWFAALSLVIVGLATVAVRAGNLSRIPEWTQDAGASTVHVEPGADLPGPSHSCH
ncbi:MAG: sulfite exporter TauE/SafE family protein [Myxococcota bacterium]